MKGIRANRKIDDGRSAINRLNAIDEARVTSTPFLNPFEINFRTSFTGTPSNPGSISFEKFSLFLKGLRSVVFCICHKALRLRSRLLI